MPCLCALYLQQPPRELASHAYTAQSASGRLLGGLAIRFHSIVSMQRIKILLVFIDTFTRWGEAFPIQTERAQEVSKQLLKEVLPRFVLSHPYKVTIGLLLLHILPKS